MEQDHKLAKMEQKKRLKQRGNRRRKTNPVPPKKKAPVGATNRTGEQFKTRYLKEGMWDPSTHSYYIRKANDYNDLLKSENLALAKQEENQKKDKIKQTKEEREKLYQENLVRRLP